MNIKEHDVVRVIKDKYGLEKGTVGTVISVYVIPPGYTVEFIDKNNKSEIFDLYDYEVELVSEKI